MRTSFLGTVVERPTAPPETNGWQWSSSRWAMTLAGQTPGSNLYVWDSLVLLLRGIVRPSGNDQPIDLDQVASEIREHYLETGSFPTDRLEGGFNLVLLDGEAERVLLYRNFAASGELFYRSCNNEFHFSSNLADLLATAPEQTRPESTVLPEYLLHGFTSGRETLVVDCFSLRPGELLRWENGSQVCRNVQLDSGSALSSAQETSEETLGRILRDVAIRHGRAATLLTGDASSSHLQSVYNNTARSELLPTTFSAMIDSESGWAGTEQIMLASRVLGTEHRLIPVETHLVEWLQTSIRATAQPQLGTPAFLMSLLAPAVARHGFAAVLSAVGAPEADRSLELGSSHSWWQRALQGLSKCLGGVARTATSQVPTDLEAIREYLGKSATARAVKMSPDPLGSILDTAGQAITLFNLCGIDLVCPYLDSRFLARMNPGTRNAGALGPIETWLAPEGLLRPLVAQMSTHAHLSEATRRRLLQPPTPFLARLLACDLWQRSIAEIQAPRHPLRRPSTISEAA